MPIWWCLMVQVLFGLCVYKVCAFAEALALSWPGSYSVTQRPMVGLWRSWVLRRR